MADPHSPNSEAPLADIESHNDGQHSTVPVFQTRKRRPSTSPDTPSSSPDAQHSRKRGRPRKVADDAKSPGERRRTQIRLAQRAYRSRQETTVSSLRKRVLDLESTVKQISQAFFNVGNEVMNSGSLAMYPEIAHNLRTATERCHSLVKQVKPGSGDKLSMEELELVDAGQGQESPDKEFSSSLDSLNGNSRWTHEQITDDMGVPGTTNAVSVAQRKTPSLKFDDSGINPLLDEQIGGMEVPGLANIDRRRTSNLPYEDTLQTSLDLDYAQRANTFIPESLAAPTCALPTLQSADLPFYPAPFAPPKFEEFSFAHRLLRRVVERGYILASSASYSSRAVAKKLGFMLNVLSKEQIIAFFEIRLRLGSFSLDSWNIPLVSMGGAGTHYPRNYPQYNHPIFPVKVLPESSKQHLDPGDQESEWFDIYDLQGYLEASGILFAVSPSFTSFVSPGGEVQSMSIPQQDFNIWSTTPSRGPTVMPSTKRRFAIIDEASTIDKLVSHCICLCRGPGFRRTDVERIIWESVRPVSA